MKKPKRKRWTVRWSKRTGEWKVITPLGWRSFTTKKDAIDYGREKAKENKPSQLIVCNRDGTYAAEYTYGDDPFPPRG